MKLSRDARFSTICLHAGQEPDPSTGAIVTPIYQTSTYVQDELGVHKGYEYARTQNPTRFALEQNIAAIEGGKAGFAFASGMAAIAAIGTMLKAGDHVIVSKNYRDVPVLRQGADALGDQLFLRGHSQSRRVNRRSPRRCGSCASTPTNPSCS